MLQQLTSLNLTYCREITDTGLAHVATLQQLTSLNLYICNKITAAGRALGNTYTNASINYILEIRILNRLPGHRDT